MIAKRALEAAVWVMLSLMVACTKSSPQSRDAAAADGGVRVTSDASGSNAAAGAGARAGDCGGPRRDSCPGTGFCDYASGSQCGADYAGGTCRERPADCAPQRDPVCGCDGRTYDNACLAAANGVSVAHANECPTLDCDPSKITCKRVAPVCPRGLVPTVVDGCYGYCTAIENCPCTNSDQCPQPGQYICQPGTGHCTEPYV